MQMTKAELRMKARTMLIMDGTNAFSKVWEWPDSDMKDWTDDDKEAFCAVMSDQLERVEAMFGFVRGSFHRGC